MTVDAFPTNPGTTGGAVAGAAGGGAVVGGVVVAIGMRPRGAVSIGGDAAGIVVVVDETVEDVVPGDFVGETDDEHAPVNITTPRSATHRTGPRRTPS